MPETAPVVVDPKGTVPAGPPSVAQLVGADEVGELLARRSRGERLTPSENGKVGAWAAKTGTKLPGRPPKPASAKPVDTGAVPSAAQTVGEVPEVVSGAVRDTAQVLFEGLDDLKEAMTEARLSKLEFLSEDQKKKFAGMSRMSATGKKVLCDSSPAVLASMGVNLENVPVYAFCSVLATEMGRFGLMLRELNVMAKDAAKLKAETKK